LEQAVKTPSVEQKSKTFLKVGQATTNSMVERTGTPCMEVLETTNLLVALEMTASPEEMETTCSTAEKEMTPSLVEKEKTDL
jgi:hypothetical protein